MKLQVKNILVQLKPKTLPPIIPERGLNSIPPAAAPLQQFRGCEHAGR